jgi:general L-amino acid transport system substrate-binding protein
LGALVLLASVGAARVNAGETLEQVKAKGQLRCGVSHHIAGFSTRDADGRWSGMDVDFCRAVAAAVTGDPENVHVEPLTAAQRFPALLGKSIDLLSADATWTLGREAGLHVHFAGVLYYDHQAFLVPRNSGVRDVPGLAGSSVCLEKGTTHIDNTADYFAQRGWTYKPVIVESFEKAADAFLAGRCEALAGDAAALAGMRAEQADGGEALVILSTFVSNEPLGPVVRSGDEDWFRVIRWVLFLLIAAERRDFNQADALAALSGAKLEISGLPLHATEYAKALGIDPKWALRAIAAVGNYGEMFERNLGKGSRLQLERGMNALWTDGGLMYAPPLR